MQPGTEQRRGEGGRDEEDDAAGDEERDEDKDKEGSPLSNSTENGLKLMVAPRLGKPNPSNTYV